jgi:hypothetical protein
VKNPGPIDDKKSRLAYILLQISYLFWSVPGIGSHWKVLMDIYHSPDWSSAFFDSFVPTILSDRTIPETPAAEYVSLIVEMKRFYKWDAALMIVSMWIGGSWWWLGRGWNRNKGIIVFNIISLALFGFNSGAVVPYMHQAWLDEKERREQQSKKSK